MVGRGYKPKRFKRVKKFYRRRSVGRQAVIKGGHIIHYFKRTFVRKVDITNDDFQTITTDGTNYNTFKLNQLPNYSDFTNLYDSYKICAIKRKYIFNKNNADSGTSYELPMLITVNDYNDVSALGSENEALEYSSCKQTRLDKITKRYFKPTVLIGETSGTVQSTTLKRRWFPTSESAVVNMGLKEAVIAVAPAGGAGLGTLNIYTTFYIACRTPR